MADFKTEAQRKKLGALLGEGVPVTKALLQAGWSEAQAAKGWAKVPNAVISTLPKTAQRLAALGRTDKETRKDLIRGRLLDNTLKGKDGGAQSAKYLGADTELNMWQPDVQQGLIVIQMPQWAVENKDKLLDEPRDE
jgi:hypothetical protein